MKRFARLRTFPPITVVLLLVFNLTGYGAAAAKAPSDPLGRESPQSTVTNFLKACQGNKYQLASQYLDLREIPERRRADEGVTLAKDLEAILNSDNNFNIGRLSQSPQGSQANPNTPDIEQITTITRDNKTYAIDLERIQTTNKLQVWEFSPQTVAEIPDLAPANTESWIDSHLPSFLVKTMFLETPIWKWFALVLLAIVVVLVFRLAARVLTIIAAKLRLTTINFHRWAWIAAIIDPAVVFCAVLVFRIVEGFLAPSALSRLYIGRFLLLVVIASFAWGFVNLVDVFMNRLDRVLNAKQRIVSQSLIYLGRRFFKLLIVCFAALTVLSNWGYDMTTILAGLGVGGIAVALAAQSTIANVFGGVSVIGDAPVTVGDFGNFGGVIGTVEDIGMRSTRIRTLNRTIMSIPNSSFAGINLENYSVRDKILFNPTFQVKRATPKDQIRHAMAGIQEALSKNKMVELGPTPVRISSLSTASFGIEIFAYVLTPDINEFYKVEAELFLTIDDVLTGAGVELA